MSSTAEGAKPYYYVPQPSHYPITGSLALLLMLLVMLFRVFKGHFDAEHHFAFEASAWYWHFVDVVWLLLFVLVYWLG